jgi:hypothetical protein
MKNRSTELTVRLLLQKVDYTRVNELEDLHQTSRVSCTNLLTAKDSFPTNSYHRTELDLFESTIGLVFESS